MDGSGDGALVRPPRRVHPPPVEAQDVPHELLLPRPEILLRPDQVPHERHRPLLPPLREAVVVGRLGADCLVHHITLLKGFKKLLHFVRVARRCISYSAVCLFLVLCAVPSSWARGWAARGVAGRAGAHSLAGDLSVAVFASALGPNLWLLTILLIL